MSSHNSPSSSRKRPALNDDDDDRSSKQSTSTSGRRSRRVDANEDGDDELPWWEEDRKSNNNNNDGAGREVGRGSSSRDFSSRRDSARDDRDNRDSRGGGRGYDNSNNNNNNGRRYDDRSPPSHSNRTGGGGGWQNDRRDSRNPGNSRYNNNNSNNNDNRSKNDFNNNNNNNNRSSYQGHNRRDSQREDVQLNYNDKPITPTGPRSHHSHPSSTQPPIATTIPTGPQPSSELSAIIIEEEEIDPEIIIAERRRKRAEILAKYSNVNNSEVNSTTVSEVGTPVPSGGGGGGGRYDTPELGGKTRDGTESPTEQDSSVPFSLLKETSSSTSQVQTQTAETEVDEPEMSAADYNPDEDRKEDDRRQAERIPGRRLSGTVQVPILTSTSTATPAAVVNKVEEEEEDEDDMFSTTVKPISMDEDRANGTFIPIISRASTSALLSDNFDDEEGYYKLLLGELLDSDRYHVHANLGKGMFSSVVRAKDLLGDEGTGRGKGEEVAIKVIRSQESMYKAGMKEAGILRKLQEVDPLDKKHLIRLYRTFEHRGHLCLVFESLSMNLRDVVKRFGKDVGINLRAVRAYASQMFLALSLMKKCEIMHADIKPDNILVNESKSVLKVCDLGSASDLSENDITPYLVSRFYRAPEIILGLPYDCALDTWSIGCTLYELYTGKILFPGRTNNHMLYLMMELKGKFNHKMIKKAKFGDQHFDESVNFILVEKSDTTRIVSIPSKATHDLKSRLMSPTAIKKLEEDEIKLLSSFVDLLDKMLTLEPSKRLGPKEMLNHPFIRGSPK